MPKEYRGISAPTTGAWNFATFKLPVRRRGILRSVLITCDTSKFPLCYLYFTYNGQALEEVYLSDIAKPFPGGYSWHKECYIEFDWKDEIIGGIITNEVSDTIKMWLTYDLLSEKHVGDP